MACPKAPSARTSAAVSPAGSFDTSPEALSDILSPADAGLLAVGASPKRPATNGRAVARIMIWLVADPRYSARTTVCVRRAWVLVAAVCAVECVGCGVSSTSCAGIAAGSRQWRSRRANETSRRRDGRTKGAIRKSPPCLLPPSRHAVSPHQPTSVCVLSLHPTDRANIYPSLVPHPHREVSIRNRAPSCLSRGSNERRTLERAGVEVRRASIVTGVNQIRF